MLVVVAEKLPPAVRGRMKLWFVEPRPGVFVSGLKDALAKRVIDYLFDHCPEKSGLIIFSQQREAPGYHIHTRGESARHIVEISGLQLIKVSAEVTENDLKPPEQVLNTKESEKGAPPF